MDCIELTAPSEGVPFDLEVVQELSLAPQGDWISYITLGDEGEMSGACIWTGAGAVS